MFFAALLAITATAAAETAKLSCGQCIALQEGIYRSIRRNISGFEKKTTGGISTTATLEVGQIIWNMCSSDAWRDARPSDEMIQACADHQRPHTDLMTEYWKEKGTDEYYDGALALRMKRAVCPNPEVDACSLDELPDDYSPLSPKGECAMCQAVAADVFGIIQKCALPLP